MAWKGASSVVFMALAVCSCSLGLAESAKSIHEIGLELERSQFRPVVAESFATSTPIVASIVLGPDGVPKVETGKATAYRVVWVEFLQSVEETGWARLEVHTNESFPDKIQAEAAGFLEGYLTGQMIWNAYVNSVQEYCQGDKAEYCRNLMAYLSSMMSWANAQEDIASSGEDRAYWHQYSLIMTQLGGMINGYNIVGAHSLHLQDFLIMSLNGDLETLEHVLNMPGSKGPKKVAASSCSAMVRLLPEFQEVFFTHDTWDSYYRMLRIYKNYDLRFSTDGSADAKRIPGAKVGFSSYAMNLQSNDDFYTIGSGLAVMETTIGNNNDSLYKEVVFNTLPYYFRVQIANRLATTGTEWAKIFAMHNSGTYNNMWMVFDYNKFTPGTRPQAEAFTVLEQLPTFIHVEDMTEHLVSKSYFSSYNIAYFPSTFKLGGFEELVKEHGDFFKYDTNPRAQIFADRHRDAVTLESVMSLMRYNDFQHDKYGKCKCVPPFTGENAIAARSDLNPANGTYEFPFFGHRIHGATDCKITNSAMMKELAAYVVSGPTHRQQPVFKWSTSGESTRPLGHPDTWDFAPITVRWTEL